jgi:hypothetical protein
MTARTDENVGRPGPCLKRAASRSANLRLKFASSSRGARRDIGVYFAELRGVNIFRRSNLATAVAVLLIVLAVSPVTAPFSTLTFAGTARRGASVVHKTVDSLKTIQLKILVASGFDGRTEILALIESPVRFLSASVDRESTLFAVLRI